MVRAVACANVPKLTVVVGGTFGAGNYGEFVFVLDVSGVTSLMTVPIRRDGGSGGESSLNYLDVGANLKKTGWLCACSIIEIHVDVARMCFMHLIYIFLFNRIDAVLPSVVECQDRRHGLFAALLRHANRLSVRYSPSPPQKKKKNRAYIPTYRPYHISFRFRFE